MRTLSVGLALLLACASSKKEAGGPPSAAAVAGPDSAGLTAAPVPAPKSTPEPASTSAVGQPGPAGPAVSATQGPMTAAEAAAAVRAERKGGAGDAAPPAGDDSCTTDADCVFTRFAPGACCPMLCMPRAVTKAGAEAAEAHVKTCEPTHPCPQPSCRAPPQQTYPACIQNKCAAKVREGKTDQ